MHPNLERLALVSEEGLDSVGNGVTVAQQTLDLLV